VSSSGRAPVARAGGLPDLGPWPPCPPAALVSASGGRGDCGGGRLRGARRRGAPLVSCRRRRPSWTTRPTAVTAARVSTVLRRRQAPPGGGRRRPGPGDGRIWAPGPLFLLLLPTPPFSVGRPTRPVPGVGGLWDGRIWASGLRSGATPPRSLRWPACLASVWAPAWSGWGAGRLGSFGAAAKASAFPPRLRWSSAWRRTATAAGSPRALPASW